MNRHDEIEDGMGFSGLVSTPEEKRRERYEEAQRAKISALQHRAERAEAERDALLQALRNVFPFAVKYVYDVDKGHDGRLVTPNQRRVELARALLAEAWLKEGPNQARKALEDSNG